MRPALSIPLTVALAYALGLFLPWWSTAVAAAAVMAGLGLRPLPAFLLGFASVFLFWSGWILSRSIANDHILAQRMSAFVLGAENPWLLMALSTALGGLMGGLGGLCGSLFIRAVRPAPPEDLPASDDAEATPDADA
jgi:hypothetical protein